jgi:acyl-coenzyme A thioesterase PaaI-like protein
VLAAPWVPHASLDDGTGRVAPEFLWAALDCAGAFAVMEDLEQPIILGELSARLDRKLAIGEPAVVVAWPLGIDGRKRFAGTALYSAAGMPIASARATWIVLRDAS